MTNKPISQEEFDKAWFDVLLPAPEHDYRPAPNPAPEHEHVVCMQFDVYIDFVTGNKWQGTIKQHATGRLVWRSVPWSERENAMHATMHRITSGKIFEDLSNLHLDDLENEREG